LANKEEEGVCEGVSSRMFDDCVEIFRGYGAVDDVLAQCERIGGHSTPSSHLGPKRRERQEGLTAMLRTKMALLVSSPVNERTVKDS